VSASFKAHDDDVSDYDDEEDDDDNDDDDNYDDVTQHIHTT